MKLAVLGTGKIVTEALVAMAPIEEISINAIFARPHSKNKAEGFAEKYSIKSIFTDYDELIKNADIDTVYIGLINSVHYEYAKKALENNLNVILEKPFVGKLSEAIELAEIAKAHNCFLFEAITVLHNEVFNKMKTDLPKLGNIKMVIANYSQYSSRYDRYLNGDVDYSFDPNSLGGSLRDINIYNIHYVAALLGLPENVQYFPNRGFNGIDTSGALVLTYPTFTAVCIGAKDSDSPCFVSVQGEKGYMKIDGKPNTAPNLTVVTYDSADDSTEKDSSGSKVRAAAVDEFIPKPVHHRMTQEFKDFARIIAENDIAAANNYLEESLDVMRILDSAF